MEAKPSYKMSSPAASFRPTLMGRDFAVSCGHPLAAMAAANVLQRGGNAIDAGVTAAMALAVLQPDIVSFAGVAPPRIVASRVLQAWDTGPRARISRDCGPKAAMPSRKGCCAP